MQLIPFRKNGLFGFSDVHKNLIIQPQYKQVLMFETDCAYVMSNNELWGAINEKGEIVIPFELPHQPYFDESGWSYMNQESAPFYLNRNGDRKPASLNQDKFVAYDPESVLSAAEKNGKYAIIDQSGKVILPLKEYNYSFKILKDNLFVLDLEGEMVFFDFNGNKISAFPKTLINGVNQYLMDDFFLVSLYEDGKGNKMGVMHLDGHFKIPMQDFLWIPEGDFHSDYILIFGQNNNSETLCGWMNFEGKILEPAVHHFLWPFGKHHFLFDNQVDLPYLIDFKGKRMPDADAANFRIPNPQVPFEAIPNGFTMFITAHKHYGITNKNGQVCFQTKDSWMNSVVGNPPIFSFRGDSGTVFVDENGAIVHQCKYPYTLEPIAEGSFWKFSDEKGLRGLLDKNFKTIFTSKKAVENIDILGQGNFFQLYYTDSKQAIVKADGTFLKLPDCHRILYKNEYFILIKNISGAGSFAGSVDLEGKWIVPMEHLCYFNNEKGDFLLCFEKFKPNILTDFSGQVYWVDFAKNVVYREEINPLPLPNDYKPKDILNFKINKPTDKWKDRAPYFTPETAAIADNILNQYIDEVAALPKKGLQKALRASVKNVIVAFNNFNINHRPSPDVTPLETLERDEVVSFIRLIAENKGLNTQEDITMAYRDF
jgi:hypothetical protein